MGVEDDFRDGTEALDMMEISQAAARVGPPTVIEMAILLRGQRIRLTARLDHDSTETMTAPTDDLDQTPTTVPDRIGLMDRAVIRMLVRAARRRVKAEKQGVRMVSGVGTGSGTTNLADPTIRETIEAAHGEVLTIARIAPAKDDRATGRIERLAEHNRFSRSRLIQRVPERADRARRRGRCSEKGLSREIVVRSGGPWSLGWMEGSWSARK